MNYYIRPIGPQDKQDIHELRTAPGVFENILSLPTETIMQYENLFNAITPNLHLMVAAVKLADGTEKCVGVASVQPYTNPRVAHTGSFGIMVHPEFQNMGIGSSLIQYILDFSDNWLMLKRIELTVFTENKKAVGLYEKFGFVREGTKRCSSVRNGIYADEYIMARIKD